MGEPLLRSEPLIGSNRFIGQKELPPFAVPDQSLNGIQQVVCSVIGIPEFSRSLQIVPEQSGRSSHR